MGNLSGYWNADGKAGIRNHVVVLSLSVFSNVAAINIANMIDGTVPLTHPHGRAEIGINKVRLEENLVGQILNPNVQAALLVGYEEKTTERYLKRLKGLTRKPLEFVNVLKEGSIGATEVGARKALELASVSSEVRREPIDFKDVTVGIKCGSTDATSGIASNPAIGNTVDYIVREGGSAIFSETTEIMGAEHILARRASDDKVAQKIFQAVKNNEQTALDNGVDMLGVNPVPDNIEGGISTIEEKSLGAIRKSGSATIMDVLQLGERIVKPGLYFLDYPAAAQEVLTALTSTGCQLILFSTGAGNPSGTPIAPVLKVTGNARTVARIGDHIDVDVSGIFTEGMEYDTAGRMILARVEKVINGAKTKAELLMHHEFSPVAVGL